MFLNLLNRFHVASRASTFKTWVPTRRTHLLHVGVALFLGFISFTSTSTPREAPAIIATALALACLPLASFLPIAGAIASFIVAWGAQLVPYDVGAIAPSACWGVVAILLTRGLPRYVVYSFSCAVLLFELFNSAWFVVSNWFALIGVPCIALGEAIRHHREQTDAFLRQREQNFERQRRLITSELHDTVVRDLTHAVMAAQYAKTAHSDNGVSVHEFDAIITQVRRSVGQLRRALIMIGESNDDKGLPLRASAPRPIQETVEEARRSLEGRGIRLQAEGIDILAGEDIIAGTRQQAIRVFEELIGNAVKYVSVPGDVTVFLEIDAAVLRCLITNSIDDDPPAADTALSSGMGLKGVRRRIELLGGSFMSRRKDNRWISIFTIPLQERVAEQSVPEVP
mgnify:FL=1